MRNARNWDPVSSKPCLFQRVGLVLKPSPRGPVCVLVQAPENKLITVILIGAIRTFVLAWRRGRDFRKRTNGGETCRPE